MKINIERLQHGDGVTTTMLIEALQNSDFTGQEVIVTAHSRQYARDLMLRVSRLASEMGFLFERLTVGSLKIYGEAGEVTYTFISKKQLDRYMFGREAVVFSDHF